MYALFFTMTLGIIQNLFRSPLSLPASPVISTSRHASMNSLSNYTRKDAVQDVFAFLAGATAAEASFTVVRFLSDKQRNQTIEESLSLL